MGNHVQVGLRIDREGGDRPLMCCEDAKEQFAAIKRMIENMRAVIDYFEPKRFTIIGGDLPILNYCPRCGTKYQK